MGNQEAQLMLGKQYQEKQEQRPRNSEQKTQYIANGEQSESASIRQAHQQVVLDKELEDVAKINHKVDVIKMLKQRKGKEDVYEELPPLSEPKRQQLKQEFKKQRQNLKLPELSSQPKQEEQPQNSMPLVCPPPNLSQIKPSPQSSVVQQLDQPSQQSNSMLKQNVESIAYSPSNSPIEQSLRTQLSQEEEVRSSEIYFDSFSKVLKSNTIELCEGTAVAEQMGQYYENQKLILTDPITSPTAKATFQIDNLKYCVGFGLALKEVIEKHEFNYKSYANELSHGLYIVTSQGYSWSHHLKQQDDVLHAGFNKLKNCDKVEVELTHGILTFRLKQFSFMLEIPENVVKRYTLCFCAYLHQKEDAVRLLPASV